MFKRKIKLKVHNLKCDIREAQYGNWIDLAINGTTAFKAPKIQIKSNSKGEYQSPKFFDKKVDLGVSMTLPKWYRAEIKPRSSTFGKYGLLLTNGVGEIEYNYSDLWKAHFLPFKDVVIEDGTRLLQFQISLRPDAPWYMKVLELFRSGFKYELVDVLTTTRGGYGSSGTKNSISNSNIKGVNNIHVGDVNVGLI